MKHYAIGAYLTAAQKRRVVEATYVSCAIHPSHPHCADGRCALAVGLEWGGSPYPATIADLLSTTYPDDTAAITAAAATFTAAWDAGRIAPAALAGALGYSPEGA